MSLGKVLDEIDDSLTSRRGRRAPPKAEGKETKSEEEHEPIPAKHPLVAKLCDDCRAHAKPYIEKGGK